MVALMERDIQIYRLLSSGPSERESLWNDYRESVLKIKRDNLAESNKPKAKTKSGKMGFFTRLQILTRNGYLRSQQYRRKDNKGFFTLFALTEISEGILCREANYRQEFIRRNLPVGSRVSHDLQVTDAVRAVKREARMFPYDVLITDEDWQRKTTQKKKQAFSDLFVKVRLSIEGKEKNGNFHIEIDNNTISPIFVKEKVRKMIDDPTFILCTTSGRKNNLMSHFKGAYDAAIATKSEKHPDKGLKSVYFALTSDFCASNRGGILNTKWENIEGIRAKIFKQ